MKTAEQFDPEPRWPALVAGLAAGVLFYLVPDPLTFGPGWLPLALITAMLIPATVFHSAGRRRLNEVFAYLGLGVITLALLTSLILLVVRLLNHQDTPSELLRGAAALWVSNVLVFASWYWRLDAGGPN